MKRRRLLRQVVALRQAVMEMEAETDARRSPVGAARLDGMYVAYDNVIRLLTGRNAT